MFWTAASTLHDHSPIRTVEKLIRNRFIKSTLLYVIGANHLKPTATVNKVTEYLGYQNTILHVKSILEVQSLASKLSFADVRIIFDLI
jgi:hypothetical protein